MKITTGLLIMISTIALAACRDESSIIKLENDKKCRPLNLKVGQEIVVSLEGNPSTDYRWLLVNQPNFLRLTEEIKEVNHSNKGQLGRAERHLWRYQVRSKGKGNLRFMYQRPWESDQVCNKQFNCKIISQ